MKRLFSFILALSLTISLFPFSYAASDEAITAAQSLYELGLFSGTGSNADGTPNFDLERTPTRAEAVTMLVRLLGKENDAKSEDWNTPFSDVVDWAKPYVGYAYTYGLTSGTSEDTFGGELEVSASQYLTFVLRALGYESGTDFQWDRAWELSDELDLTNGQYGTDSHFTRGDVAIISNQALSLNLKDSNKSLLSSIQNPQNSGLTIDDLHGAWTYITEDGTYGTAEIEFLGNTFSFALITNDTNYTYYTQPYFSITKGKDGTYDIKAPKSYYQCVSNNSSYVSRLSHPQNFTIVEFSKDSIVIEGLISGTYKKPRRPIVTETVLAMTDKFYRISSATDITLNSPTDNLSIGDSFQMVARTVPDNANISDYVSWASDNPNVAIVSDTGLVTAVSSGTAYISACLPQQPDDLVAATTISVSSPPTSQSKYYIDYYGVPDFGYCFNISPYRTAKIGDATSYFYSIVSLMAAGYKGGTPVDIYDTVLQDCGFSFYGSFETSQETPSLVYANYHLKLFVTMAGYTLQENVPGIMIMVSKIEY